MLRRILRLPAAAAAFVASTVVLSPSWQAWYLGIILPEGGSLTGFGMGLLWVPEFVSAFAAGAIFSFLRTGRRSLLEAMLFSLAIAVFYFWCSQAGWWRTLGLIPMPPWPHVGLILALGALGSAVGGTVGGRKDPQRVA